MYNADGDTVSSELRADTFAEHLATVQWRVRPVTLVPGVGDAIHPTLRAEEGNFTEKELMKAIAALKNDKSWCWEKSNVSCLKQ